MNLYVYYDVAAADSEPLANDVRTMQARLLAGSGVAGRLMRREPAASGRVTWMEVYEGVDDTFETRLAEAVSALDWRRAGTRHAERFVER